MSVASATRPYRWLISLLFHALIVTIGYWLAFLLRFEFPIETEDVERYLITLPIILALRLSAFAWFHLYERLWRYVSMTDILAILKAVTVSSLVAIPILVGAIDKHFPWPIFPIDWGICLLFVGGMRLALRAFHESVSQSTDASGRRALIIGAGDAGELLIREIGRNASLNYQIVGFVDDDLGKQKRRIHGVEVVGVIDQLPELSRKYDAQNLLIAIPSATGGQMRRIIAACRAARVDFKTMPSLGELNEQPFRLSAVRRVSIEDLLRREPLRMDQVEVKRFVHGKRIVVTGAGGSIGSELCRQLARFTPERLILLDHAENSLFFVEMELRERFSNVAFEVAIADVTHEVRMESLFQMHRPHIVFHAAAHKHVPLMEANKAEAVKNNVRGTMVVADAAWHAGVEVFVMISTDKAVRPASIMGVTKRLAEMYVQSLNPHIETRFMTVRFGNVLGSDASVLQVFQKQIEVGGPVTITHPSMKRYFMTIPEAAQLVLQAATQGTGGEIFVLDMGDPVSIVDLAKDLIALSGLDPEKDIEIKFTGPRPGEKLFEELLNPETRILPTTHEKVMIAQTKATNYDRLYCELSELIALAEKDDEGAMLVKVAALVPEYRPDGALSQAIRAKGMGRILVIERDAYTRATLKRILEPNYQVVVADGDQEAYDKVRECLPDLVILDWDSPDGSIRELCDRLKEAFRCSSGSQDATTGNGRPAILVIMESSGTATLDEVRALGADDRVYRPIPVRILEARVKRLIASRSRSEQHGGDRVGQALDTLS